MTIFDIPCEICGHSFRVHTYELENEEFLYSCSSKIEGNARCECQSYSSPRVILERRLTQEAIDFLDRRTQEILEKK